MLTTKMKIMIRAALIRMDAGETIDEILASWPALTADQKAQIQNAITS